jgi:CRISPR-associated protein Cas2
MLLISYDISNNKLRTRFAKFLEKYGHRLQYSVFQIQNSDRILENIQLKIKHDFEKKFEQSDSIMIFQLSNTCKITRYGFAENQEKDLIILG